MPVEQKLNKSNFCSKGKTNNTTTSILTSSQSVLLPCIIIFSDFDDDGTLDSGDLEKLINCLTGETDDTRLTPEEMRQLITNVSQLCFLSSEMVTH